MGVILMSLTGPRYGPSISGRHSAHMTARYAGTQGQDSLNVAKQQLIVRKVDCKILVRYITRTESTYHAVRIVTVLFVVLVDDV